MENARESQAKWYVLHTYSGYESMVKSSLEQLIENNNLQNSIFDLKIPMEQTIEEKNGKRKEDEVRKMQLETVVVDADFAAGDTVSIDAGPLAGFVGKIKKCSDSAQKATVSVVMFGRNTDVEVDYAQLRKLSAALPEEEQSAPSEES